MKLRLFLLSIFLSSQCINTLNSPFKHVIVLGMENHSYDNMLGFMPPPIGNLATKQYCNYVNGKEYCTNGGANYSTHPDPPHDYFSMNFEEYGTLNFPSNNSTEANNSGFAERYQNKTNGNPQNVMNVYTPQQVPIISKLAEEFTVANNWFCSVPSCTVPNKIFYHCATSNGNLKNPPGFNDPQNDNEEKKLLHTTENGEKIYEGQYGNGWPVYCDTIQQQLQKAGYSWEIHWMDWSETIIIAPMGQDLKRAILDPNFEKLFKDMEDGTLADYNYLVPRVTMDLPFGVERTENPWLNQPNTQHPAEDIRGGEYLIKNVYEHLRASQYWNDTLFIVTYDENGGFFDHVPPPRNVTNPSPHKKADYDFEFDRLGGRIPGLLISPWLAKKVDSTQYEQSSIPRTIHDIFNLTSNYLTPREAQAHPLIRESDILPEPRTDCPMTLPEVPSKQEVPLSHWPEELWELAGTQADTLRISGTRLINIGLLTREEYQQIEKSITTEQILGHVLKEMFTLLGHDKYEEGKIRFLKAYINGKLDIVAQHQQHFLTEVSI